MSIIKIIDNVVSLEIFKLAQEEFSKGIWGFNNANNSIDPNVSFGAKEYCDKVNKLLSEKRLNESNIIYNLWTSINSQMEIEKNYKNILKRINFNCGPPLYDQGIHQDDEVTFSKNITIVYFVHPQWDFLWGGELLIFDKSKENVTGGTFPIPNRAVVFPSYLPHRAVAVTRISPSMRISIAFQCQFDHKL